MFYPEDSLKRGGRFYLLWVADSWPHRFAAITHRQLWSQDIRKLCDDLLEVITNESGRPSNRFSLRLSSQLLRGLVRLYERKVSVFLGDLCMIHAHVFKHANKKSIIRDTVIIEGLERPQLPHLPATLQEEPEEERVEELIRNSGNVVVNIQDITLKEAVIPDFQLPPNDGFGEEHPNQPLQQLLADRTVEMMLLQPETSAVHHSGLEIPDADKSHDKSRIVDSHLMEQISELDMTLLRKSAVEEPVPGDFGKDIPVIPEVPLPEPELPAPPEKRVSEEVHEEIPVPQPQPPQPQVEEPPQPQVVESPQPQVVEPPQPQVVEPSPKARAEPEEMELEGRDETIKLNNFHYWTNFEVEEKNRLFHRKVQCPLYTNVWNSRFRSWYRNELQQIQPRKRRGKTKLIIDKRIKLSAGFLRSRIDEVYVELRCEDSTDDIVDTRVPYEVYMRRPAHAGCRFPPMVTDVLTRLFQRNLGVVATLPLAERDLEEAVGGQQRRRTRSVLEKIVEEEEPPPVPQVQPPQVDIPQVEISQVEIPQIEMPQVAVPQVEVAQVHAPETTVLQEVPRVSVQEPMDIADLPTQKLETLPQVARKRTSEYEPSPKRARMSGFMSFRESQHQQLQGEIANEPADKENIPPVSENIPPISENIPLVSENIPPVSENLQQPPPRDQVRNISTMLQEAGIAETQLLVPEVVDQAARAGTQTLARTRGDGSESSETQLGSLDRTKVSLGDSVKTTDSQRFIRSQWGIEGTMVKILTSTKAGICPLTVEGLVAKGPVMCGYRSVIAARCFTSILQLKRHAFVNIVKDPETLEIRDITLGSKFDGLA